jgi:hypothetical protein
MAPIYLMTLPGQQAAHERGHPPARLDPCERGTHPQHELVEFPPPAIQVYVSFGRY